MAARAVVPGADSPTAAEHGPDVGFYARALADPLFRGRFEAAYRGEDDPLDALWWLDRPGETAPSGATAPTARAASARRALYGPGTDPAALDRYELATAAAERSRSAAVAALGRLPVQPVTPLAAPPGLPRRAAASAPGRRRVLLPVAALAVLALAVAFGLGRASRAPEPPPPLVEHFQQTVTGDRATAVFDRAPEAADLLGGDLQPLDPVNLRRLVTIGTVRFLAGRTRGDGAAMCLIAAEGTVRTAARCVSDVDFERAGVVLAPGDGLPSGFARVRWQPDGALVWWSPAD